MGQVWSWFLLIAKPLGWDGEFLRHHPGAWLYGAQPAVVFSSSNIYIIVSFLHCYFCVWNADAWSGIPKKANCSFDFLTISLKLALENLIQTQKQVGGCLNWWHYLPYWLELSPLVLCKNLTSGFWSLIFCQKCRLCRGPVLSWPELSVLVVDLDLWCNIM